MIGEEPAFYSSETIDPLPSYERKGSGLDIVTIFMSIKEIALQPAATFRALPVAGGVGRALLFSLLTGTSFNIIGWFWAVLIQRKLFELAGRSHPVISHLFGDVGTASFFFGLVTIPLAVLAFMFIAGAIHHLFLVLFGGAGRDYLTTVRVFGYAYGAISIFSVIPFLGQVVRTLWLIVVLIVGIREAHETTTAKAALAIVVPLVAAAVLMGIVTMIGGLLLAVYSG